jgi:hypothetical protein
LGRTIRSASKLLAFSGFVPHNTSAYCSLPVWKMEVASTPNRAV